MRQPDVSATIDYMLAKASKIENGMAATLSAHFSEDRHHALARGQRLSDRARGSALLADISGFTPLTEKLTQRIGCRI